VTKHRLLELYIK